jgi:hypothetical protein
MSEKHLFINKDKDIKDKDITPLKDAAILAGWIAGIILVAGLAWFFTQPVRDRFMIMSVNAVLEQSADPRRLGAPLQGAAHPPGSSRMGSWFTMTAPDLPAGTRVFVFAFIAEGTFFPCAAVVSPQGVVQEFIPLSVHGERALRRVSPGMLDVYSRRISGGGL